MAENSLQGWEDAAAGISVISRSAQRYRQTALRRGSHQPGSAVEQLNLSLEQQHAPVELTQGEALELGSGVQAEKGPYMYSIGTRVKLSGLASAAHLNGLAGSVHSFDEQAQRYAVELDPAKYGSKRFERWTAV